MTFTINLTDKETEIVLNALAKEPYGLVAELITNIHTQATEQLDKAEYSEPTTK